MGHKEIEIIDLCVSGDSEDGSLSFSGMSFGVGKIPEEAEPCFVSLSIKMKGKYRTIFIPAYID